MQRECPREPPPRTLSASTFEFLVVAGPPPLNPPGTHNSQGHSPGPQGRGCSFNQLQ